MRKLLRSVAKARIAKAGLCRICKRRNSSMSPAQMKRLKPDSTYFTPRSFFSEHWRQIAGLEG